MKRFIIVLFVLFSFGCVKKVYIPIAKPQPQIKEEPITPRKKPVYKPVYKFDLSEDDRELNQNNSFLKYLEGGEDVKPAVKPRKKVKKTTSNKQRKAVVR